MKKQILITLTLAFCCFAHVNAQTDKGSTLIGGSIRFNNGPFNSADQVKSGNAQLKTGHAFTPNVLWGVQGGYLFGDKAGNAASGYSGFSAGVFNRLYKPLGNAFHLFGESALGYSHLSSRTNTGSTIRTKHDAMSLGFTPGLSYHVLDWACIELMLPDILSVNYTQNHTGPGTMEKALAATTSLSSKALNTLGLGFSIVF